MTHRTSWATGSAAIGLIAVALWAAPASASASHHLKLRGVVVGQAGQPSQTKVSVYQGRRKVGTLAVFPVNCGSPIECQQAGTANLKVGLIRGRAYLVLLFKAVSRCVVGSPGCHPPPAKFGQGHIQKGYRLEHVRVNVDTIPTKTGSTFAITLSY